MKNFVVDTIHTTPEGRVILSGPKGSIDINRFEGSSCASYYRIRFEQTPEENLEFDIHQVSVEDITWDAHRPTLVQAGTTFRCPAE